MSRQVIFDPDFEKTVEDLGGYKVVDVSLDTIIDALERDPYGFNKIENDLTSARYAIVDPIEQCPRILVMFSIDDERNVVLTHVEIHESY